MENKDELFKEMIRDPEFRETLEEEKAAEFMRKWQTKLRES